MSCAGLIRDWRSRSRRRADTVAIGADGMSIARLEAVDLKLPLEAVVRELRDGGE